jgi:hypothetical protein
MEKTIKEWLEQLPDGYRERALENAEYNLLELHRKTMATSIAAGFAWDDTPEGHSFWADVQKHYFAGTPLPPLPNQ